MRGPIVTGYVGSLFSKILYHVSLLLRELYIRNNFRNFPQLSHESLISSGP
jgi:hypothetical protein